MPATLQQYIPKSVSWKTKRVLVALFFTSIYLASTTVSFLYFSYKKTVVKSQEPEIAKQDVVTTTTEDASAAYNTVLLGYGGAGHEGGNLTDTIIVIRVAPKLKQVSLITIPRDIWIGLPIRSDRKANYKINAAYAIGNDDVSYPYKEPRYTGEAGGGEMAKYAVSTVVGMPIKYFVAVSFDGFRQVIDILEGIEVDVPKTFDDYFYPVKGLENETCGKTLSAIAEFHSKYSGFDLEKQFECRYERLHFDAGRQIMDGETALKFVRSRHSQQHGGDFARSQRQQTVLFGIKDKVFSLGVLDDAIAFINKFSDTVQTDIDEAAIQEIISTHEDLTEFAVSTINLTGNNVLSAAVSSNGQFILVPKEGVGEWSGIHKYIKEQIGALP